MDQVNPQTVPAGATSFEVGGVTYRRTDTLSWKRYDRMCAYQMELLYGRDPGKIMADWTKVWKCLNAKEGLAEAAVIAHANIKGAEAIKADKIHPMMAIALLFWIRDGEDPGDFSEELMETKRRETERLDMRFFSSEASSGIQRCSGASAPGSPDTSPTKSSEGKPQPTASPSGSA